MDKGFENLDDIFNITEPVVEVTTTSSEIVKDPEPESPKDDTKNDYEFTRAKYYQILEKGTEALDSALEVAQSSDHPRAYEVVGQLLKHNADIADKLLDLQKKMKDLKQEEVTKASTTITNNSLFVGSTAELQKLLKNQNNDK
jgi:hypothetical protein